jgi:hypothetical protein
MVGGVRVLADADHFAEFPEQAPDSFFWCDQRLRENWALAHTLSLNERSQ